jgi:hypothetical protein
MLRKNQRPLYCTDSQEQQLKQIDCTLRKLNHAGRIELRRIGHLYLTPRQYGEAGESLEIGAMRMSSALRFRHEILNAGRQQQSRLIVLDFGRLCDRCSDNRLLTAPDNTEETNEALNQDSAQEADVDSLLESTRQIEEFMTTHSTLSGAALRAFFRHLNHFGLAALKQLRDLRARSKSQTPKIELKYRDPDDHICTGCRQSLEIDGTTEGTYDTLAERQEDERLNCKEGDHHENG